MRSSFLSFATLAVIVAATFGSMAFNYAQVSARTVQMTIVQDDAAVLAIASQDSAYGCYVRFDSTSGKVSVTFDGGSPSCSGGATGLNPGGHYHFHNILKVTNKGQKDWQRLWVNTTDALVTVNLTYSTDASMTTASNYAQEKEFASALNIGQVVNVGLKVDGTTKTKADSPWSVDVTFQARASS